MLPILLVCSFSVSKDLVLDSEKGEKTMKIDMTTMLVTVPLVLFMGFALGVLVGHVWTRLKKEAWTWRDVDYDPPPIGERVLVKGPFSKIHIGKFRDLSKKPKACCEWDIEGRGYFFKSHVKRWRPLPNWEYPVRPHVPSQYD
jgi:hypothetical protein